MKTLTILTSLLLGLNLAFAEDRSAPQDTEVVTVPVSRAYIPHGFDNNDVTKIVVEGFFPNTCYKVKKQTPEDVIVDPSGEIQVTQKAYKYNGMCLMVMVPFSQTIEVGKIQQTGTYRVMDALSRKNLGVMPVAKSETEGPDDYTYAIVNDAYVGKIETDQKKIVLDLELPGDCWELIDKRAYLDGQDVLTVLPIMDFTADDNCGETPVKKLTTMELPNLRTGRYLLNVRSLNGQAVKKLFDVR